MLTHYHTHPILGVYYYHRATEHVARDLQAFAEAGLKSVWLFFDPFYDRDDSEGLRALLDQAGQVGLSVVPVLGQFLQLNDHPEVKIVNGDGTTSDDPRYWNMGCFRHPKLFELASGRALRFFGEFGDHAALYRLEGKPLMNFVHEAYYRNSVPEFGGGPMLPNCYCDYCLRAFGHYLAVRGLDPKTEPPRDAIDPMLWQHWLDCHAEAIPEFLDRLIRTVKTQTPLWATHECNDFYPASWQSVYTGNDWWRMGAVLDFGHEDMYPLEFDTHYQCYVYNYAKDVMRSAMDFKRLVTCNGQAFNSWLGYKLPMNSMSEQIYSALAHGALGLVWWTELRGEEDKQRYAMVSLTAAPNREYIDLVQRLQGYHLSRARIALLYSWTTMCQALNDHHTYDTLLMYMLLVQCGFPVDILSESQVSRLHEYQAVFVLGAAALPQSVHRAIEAYVDNGGIVFSDYAPTLNTAFLPLFSQWRGAGSQPRAYSLPDGTLMPVQLEAAALKPPADAEVLATFNDGSPAMFQMKIGMGQVILFGSYLGWDYSNYPGYYELAAMFPVLLRRDEPMRQYFKNLLASFGICSPVESSHPDVEVAVWHNHQQHMVLAINHLQETVETTIRLPLEDGKVWQQTIHLSALQGVAHQVDGAGS